MKNEYVIIRKVTNTSTLKKIPECHYKSLYGYPQVYGEVNSVENTTINVWLNNGVY